MGGWSDAHEVLLSGQSDLPEMTVFCGSCGWAPHQLEMEEKMGSWAVVSASPKCVQQILQGLPPFSCAARRNVLPTLLIPWNNPVRENEGVEILSESHAGCPPQLCNLNELLYFLVVEL